MTKIFQSISSVLFFLISLILLLPLNYALSYEFDFKNVLQSGFEYDSNIFKTYNTSVNDGLIRALYKSNASILWPATKLMLNYRLGGKKYFINPEQDTIINSFELDFTQKLNSKLSLQSVSDIKYQVETDSMDDLSLDINEDFLLFHQGLALKFDPGRGLSVKSSAHFTLFDFNNNYPGLSYYHQKYGISVLKNIGKSAGGFVYSYNRYHFKDIARTDGLNDITFLYKYTSSFYASISYTLQMNSSSNSAFSFTNHKISVIGSIPITFKRTNGSRQNLDPDLVLSIIGILRLKDYASGVVIDSEGRRFLLSESEEDNFNIVIIKITKNLNKNIALEIKYTRHSNELANTGQNYARSTLYLGGRFTF